MILMGDVFHVLFCTPMTFEMEILNIISKTDFEDMDEFIDDDCINNCYIYPVCPHCAGANYLTEKSFKTRNRAKCRLQKLITLYAADLTAKRIIKNPKIYDEAKLYHVITAIEKIRALLLPEFEMYINISKPA